MLETALFRLFGLETADFTDGRRSGETGKEGMWNGRKEAQGTQKGKGGGGWSGRV